MNPIDREITSLLKQAGPLTVKEIYDEVGNDDNITKEKIWERLIEKEGQRYERYGNRWSITHTPLDE